MLFDRLRQRGRDEKGFTLVELLVVMLILGLLAAIAIPSFFSQRDKARDADAKSAARTAQTAMETAATDADGSYAGITLANITGIEPTLNNASVTVDEALASSYVVTATSDTDNTFSITRSSDGTLSLTCTQTGTTNGGCPGGGWELAGGGG